MLSRRYLGERHGHPLSVYLVLLVASVAAPLIVAGGFLLQALITGERRTFEQGLRDTANVLVLALDREVRDAVNTLHALASSPSLERGDLAAFHEVARRALATQPTWIAVTVADPSGQLLMNTRVPFGTPLALTADPASLEEAVRRRSPVVGPVVQGRVVSEFLVPVRVPVHGEGGIRYVVSVGLTPDGITGLLATQPPRTRQLLVFDQDRRIIARHGFPDQHVGEPVGPLLRTWSGREADDWIRGASPEGAVSYVMLRRSALSGWTVALAVSGGEVDAGGKRLLWLYGLGGLGVLALSLVGAGFVAARVRRAVALLETSTRALGDGQPPIPLTRGPRELRHVATGIVRAGETIRARERAQTRLLQQNEALLSVAREARADAEEANRAKDEFLAVLSHELRTPLSAILGWALLLRRKGPAERWLVQGVETIERNARLQAELIDDLVDVSRIIAGKLTLELRSVELAPVIEAAIEGIRLTAEAKDVTLERELDPTIGPVEGDPARLQQVVSNLLANAVKFTPAGGQVRLVLSGRARMAELVVTDTGEGIDPEVLPHIFDRFRQGGTGSTRRYGGLGLGLAIVRYLVSAHGGDVEATSAGVGRGAAFTVRLPLGASEARQPPPAAAVADERRLLEQLAGRRIVAVDDHVDSLEVMAATLTGYGAEVTAVGSAAEALEAVLRTRPVVLVSDLAMRDQDGYDLIRQVRALPPESGGTTPALALTAFVGAAEESRSRAAGFQAHMTKPVEPIRFATVVADLAAGRIREEKPPPA
jgi:signal transduction histidine kinase/ActR/RegA family two-component response regulator